MMGYVPHRTSPCTSATLHFHLTGQNHKQKCIENASYAAWGIFGLIVPEFGLQYLGSHGLDIFLSVVFGDGC